jgi:Fe-S cluster biosynthesis and repair protein YggX
MEHGWKSWPKLEPILLNTNKRLNMMMIEGNKLHAYLLICNQPNYIAPKAMHSLTHKPPAQDLPDEVHLESCE